VLSASDAWIAVGSALAATADDFVSKDTDPEALRRVIVATHERARQSGRDGLPPAPSPDRPRPAVAGATLRRLEGRIPALLASAVSCVHIHGESGTGKEVVAQLFKAAAHPKPFLSVNCGAIPPSLLESTLFGAVKGSFTGALADRKGYLEAASGGWLFLDEVASLSPVAQAALLRAIENQEIIRVGDHRPLTIDVRLISAANEDLRELVAAGRFRLDLWQRLSEVEVALPPLRERPEEIPELIDHLLASMPGHAEAPYQITSAAKNLLARQPWREGNVRQLRNCLRAMTEHRVGRLLTPQAIPPRYRQIQGIDAGERPDCAPAAAAPTAAVFNMEAGVFLPLDGDRGRGDRRAASPSPYDFGRLADRLFVEVVRHLGRRQGRLSMRQLGIQLALSKSSVSRKLRDAVALGLVSPAELAQVVRIAAEDPGSP
jgi:DNA-binding NtrC family response regulator